MNLSKHKIGQLIGVVDERNSYGITDFFGININKEFMPTAANTEGLDETNYKVVRKNRFVFSGMQTGRDECIRISMYLQDEPIIVSPAYTTFEVVATDIVLPTYFFMLFLSKERDRLGWFYSDGSVRSNLDWDRFCDIELNLPDIPTQQKYVDIYNAMVANQQCYERGLEDLKLTFEGFVEQLKTTERVKPILPYIRERTEVNKPLKCEYLRGVGNTGFISPRQERTFDSLTKCNVFYKNDLVYNPSVLCAGAIALNKEYEMAICTEEYVVFYIENQNELIPEYLFIWLKRKETGRYIDFMSIDSVRNRVYFSDLNMISIPIPDIDTQKYIVDIYNCYYERASINEQLKAQIKNICPILIKGSLEKG